MIKLSAQEVYDEIDNFNNMDDTRVFVAIAHDDGSVSYGEVVDMLKVENALAGDCEKYIGAAVLIAEPCDKPKYI